MARTNAVNYTGANQFPMASAGTDIFKKEDVQTLALAVDNHDHSSGKGLVVSVAGIPAGAIDGSKITDNTVTSAKIADGTIATADLANNAVTNAKLGTDTARLNLLTDGGFEIWQRGNGPFVGNQVYSADRWLQQQGGTSTVSVSRATAPDGASYALQVTYTHNAASVVMHIHRLSGESSNLRGKTVTFAVSVLSSVANAVRLELADGLSNAFSSYHPGNSQWVRLSVTATPGASAAVLQARIDLEASGTFTVDDAMLVVGSVPADYAPLTPTDEWARCLRYYEQSPGNFIGNGYGLTTTAADIFYRYMANKGGVPTITLAAGSAFTLRVIGSNVTCTAISSASPSQTAVLLNPSVASGLAVGQGVTLSSTGGTITAEWNP